MEQNACDVPFAAEELCTGRDATLTGAPVVPCPVWSLLGELGGHASSLLGRAAPSGKAVPAIDLTGRVRGDSPLQPLLAKALAGLGLLPLGVEAVSS